MTKSHVLTAADRQQIILDLKKGIPAPRIALNRNISLRVVCEIRNVAIDKGDLTIEDLWRKEGDPNGTGSI